MENVKQGSNELNITYKCANKQCGFKIAAHDANYHTYVSIIKDLQPYLFWHTNKKWECCEEMRMSIERITVGAGVEDPTKQRSIQLDNELQLVYVCSTGRCSYRQSVPQIESKEGIRCVCSPPHMIYHADKRIYLCPKSNGGCGASRDGLSNVHACRNCQSSSRRSRVVIFASQGYGSLWATRYFEKYKLNKSNMRGELIYECRKNNTCRQVKRNILSPALLSNSVMI